MPIAWRAAAAAFEQTLRSHGAPPAAVTDVEAAYRAYADFLQTEITGIEPVDDDGDGFIVQWGRYSWHDDALVLSLTRQLTVAGGRQPELWQVSLELAFRDEPALVAAERELDAVDTGFRFEPIGPQRAAALAEARDRAHRQALVRMMWTTAPVSSELTFERVD